MNGIKIEQVFMSGALLGFVYNREENAEVFMLCLFVIGIKISWW